MKLQQELQETLRDLIQPEATAFIGLGNPDRGDDNFGLHLLEELRRIGFPHIFSEQDDLDEIILGLRENSSIKVILFLDAVDMGAEPGTPVLLKRDEFPSLQSSHEIPIGVYASILAATNKAVYCLGVQVHQLGFQQEMSESTSLTFDEYITWFETWFAETQRK